MTLFSGNIRYLRSKANLSQQEVAKLLSVPRSTYAKYELGKSEAPHSVLLTLAKKYRLSLDLLLSVDLTKVNVENLLELEHNRVLLPITVDKSGQNIIEIISEKAKAGYLSGYSDPEFIENLQHLSLPFLSKGKYRAFPIEGDSMPPYSNGSFIIGEFIEDKLDLKKGKTYIFLTGNEGIIYKRVHHTSGKTVTLCSDNKSYRNFDVPIEDILEVWKFACSLSVKEFEADDWDTQTLKEMVSGLRYDIIEIKQKLNS